MYTLNGVDFTTYGLLPSRADNSNMAIVGCWDMPARIGTTHHDWGDENGIEPYAETGQIFFGGRDISLQMVLRALDKPDAIAKVSSFYSAVNAYSGLVQLTTDWSSYQVYVIDKIDVVYAREGKAKVKILFREPMPNLVGSVPASNGSAYGIDGISFNNLGIVPLSISNTLSRPQPKQQYFKAYETEGFQITKTKERSLLLTCMIKSDSMAAFTQTISGLYKLFATPGTRTINVQGDIPRTVFLKDGFTVKNVVSKVVRLIALLDAGNGDIIVADDFPGSEIEAGYDLNGVITALLNINLSEV